MWELWNSQKNLSITNLEVGSHHFLSSAPSLYIGEVYKARLTRRQGGVTSIVAVKTLRGK